ncbi:hypothetical protein DFH07DRAFT_844425 [Mycena maculata]|uniref:Calcium uniporter protein, mitochondrial n=1 Tax=Mycena maculata TaxID=230809 RepID=A0AAD7I5X6_9AGAR|nr:hypothetical protein DFH07DRAFT_844425 [Mycena maculata]
MMWGRPAVLILPLPGLHPARMFHTPRVRSALISFHRPRLLGLRCAPRNSRVPLYRTPNLRYSTRSEAANNTDVSHSEFLAGSGSSSSWKDNRRNNLDGGSGATVDELDNLKAGRGKLSPTASHLFKLILPLGMLKFEDKHIVTRGKAPKRTPPTVILLHPSQPLSHVSRLILASLAPATPNISFRSASSSGRQFQWSDSTDVGDFIRDAARSAKFSICIGYDPVSSTNTGDASEVMFEVEVPTVADRTRFLRRRLEYIQAQLKGMEELKNACDREAHRGARRMATGGFGVLAIYWATVARLTFWDYGWDVMEPITYLSGLSTVMAGYLWFLYQGREVSYSSVLDRSISARRENLYKARGFDIERWMDLVSEAKGLRSEIRRISEDYEHHERSSEEDEEDEEDGDEDGEIDGSGSDRMDKR